MSKPRLLDLFAGAGGAAVGYARAGFEVVGVDIKPQPNYPFEFHQGDALTFPLDGFDAIHASPPCQFYSRMRHLPWLKDREYWESIPPTLARLAGASVPWVVENVMDAPLPGIWLCGLHFGLPVYRHRRFASSLLLLQPSVHPKHPETIFSSRHINKRYNHSGGVMGILPSAVGHTAGASTKATIAALGIDWMTRDEATQAIPPAMTEYVGRQLLAAIEAPAAA